MIAGIRHRRHRGTDACRGVEPDPVCKPAVTVRVIRHHKRDPGSGGVSSAKPRPAGGKYRDIGRPIRHRFIARRHRMRQRVALRRPLEPDSAGQQPPVKFGKRHIHRQVSRCQAGGGPGPVLDTACRQDKLQHRRVNRAKGSDRGKTGHRIPGRCRIRHGKTRHVQNDVGLRLG